MKQFKRWIHSGKTNSLKIKTQYTRGDSRSLHLAGFSGTVLLLLGLGKLLSGVLTLSFFVCVNGLYSLGMAAAKYCVVIGTVRAEQTEKQSGYYRLAAAILIVASLLYVAYSVWLFLNPPVFRVNEIAAITIATITFTEIGISLAGVLRHRKGNTPLLHALKTINLATSLIALVLTQSALLSFSSEVQYQAANGILGIIMGICAALLGVYMLRRMKYIYKL